MRSASGGASTCAVIFSSGFTPSHDPSCEARDSVIVEKNVSGTFHDAPVKQQIAKIQFLWIVHCVCFRTDTTHDRIGL